MAHWAGWRLEERVTRKTAAISHQENSNAISGRTV